MTGTQCVFCGQKVELIHVHGHYQCPVCKTNAMPCCDGDNCDSNNFLKKEYLPKPLQRSQRTSSESLYGQSPNPEPRTSNLEP